MQFILRNVMQSRRLGNSDKKTYKNVPLEINLATMEGEKGRLVLPTNYVTVCYVSHYRDALENK